MKTILVATDFSPVAANAADYAADMAMAINADILLLHVHEIPVVYTEPPIAMNEADMTRGAERAMIRLEAELVVKTNNKLKINIEIRVGKFFPELETICERIKPYAVVMGSQGSTAAERLILGGHAVFAMKHLMWPLITVPPSVKFSSVKKIGLACDFDEVVETIPVDEIRTLVNDFHAELHILNTSKQKMYSPELVYESGVLRNMLKDIETGYHFIAYDDTDEGIIDFAEKNQIDLLVVLPKHHSLIDTIKYRSHTKQFVLHSHVPVMSLHQ
jgi:nucleotide-binding universal stress UspA family protein